MSVDQLNGDEFFQALQVLVVEFNVVVSSTLHPKWLHCLRALLVDAEAVREINHLVVGAMDHEHGRCDLGDFVDTKRKREFVTLNLLHFSIFYMFKKPKLTLEKHQRNTFSL